VRQRKGKRKEKERRPSSWRGTCKTHKHKHSSSCHTWESETKEMAKVFKSGATERLDKDVGCVICKPDTKYQEIVKLN